MQSNLTQARFLALALMGLIAIPSAQAQSAFTIEHTEGRHIEVAYGEKPILRLMLANDTSDEKQAHETYKVYAHVMDPLDPKGERRLTKGAGSQFTHHRGIFIGWSQANIEGAGKVDTWHMKGNRQHFAKILKQETSPDSATLSVQIDWVKGELLLLKEVRTFVLSKPGAQGEILIDQSSTITATTGKTQLAGDPEHAGLQFRAHEDVSGNKSAKYMFPAGKKAGNGGDKDMPWVAMTFDIAERTYHVQHMSHPSIPKGNIYSAYRDYGRFGAYFVKTLEKDESATFKVRFFISPGAAGSEADMNQRYADYVAAVK